MALTATIIILLTNVIASQKLLVIAQNNNYTLSFSRAIKRRCFLIILTYIPLLFLCIAHRFVLQIDAFLIARLSYAIVWSIAFFIIFVTEKYRYKFTKRGAVAYILANVINIILTIGLVTVMQIFAKDYTYFCEAAAILITPFSYGITLFVINPYFIKKNGAFIREQIKKLNSIKPIKIAITGSFGKTGCKNILTSLLLKKYRVYATQGNYNTPMGIALAIKEMPTNTEVFIMEFGARKKGDIAELCKLYEPDYGIIVGVTGQHLETFGSVSNIAREKCELANFIEKNCGLVVYNADDELLSELLSDKNCCLSVGNSEDDDVFISNVTESYDKTTFSIKVLSCVNDCETRLLGEHNAKNIALCVAMATNITKEYADFSTEISGLTPSEHRLQYLFLNGIHIIDDGYNANIIGVKNAIKILSLFPNKKIIVTQGIVEAGKLTKKINMEIGKEVASVVDVAVCCGVNARPIMKGLRQARFSGEIIKCKDTGGAVKIMSKILTAGDAVLLQNDVPDFY